MDPRIEVPGGVDTCIRGLVKYAPSDVRISIVGSDAVGDLPQGRWTKVAMGDRVIEFMPLSRTAPDGARPRVPYVLQILIGLVRHRPSLEVDVIQSHRPLMGKIVRTLYPRKTHIQFIHNDGIDNLKAGSESYFTRAKFLYRLLEKSAVRNSAITVVFNAAAAERFKEYGSGVHFSPTWFDDEHAAAQHPTDPARRGRILWVGRVDTSKDPILAIDCFRLLPTNYVLTLVGGGPLRTEVQQRIDELGLSERVELVGSVPKSKVFSLMSTSSALLMTSRYEGYPRVVVEALSVGLPVATTEGGEPNGLIVEGVNGARVTTRAPSDLAAAVRRAESVSRTRTAETGDRLRASNVVPTVLSLTAEEDGFRP